MSVKIVSLNDIEPLKLPGRDLQWIATPERLGCEKISFAIMTCHPHAVVKPVHSHKGIEEILFILDGEGEAWVDGEYGKFKKGDAVLFPVDSKHQVRNSGDIPLMTVSIFSAPTTPDSYIMYDEDMFT